MSNFSYFIPAQRHVLEVAEQRHADAVGGDAISCVVPFNAADHHTERIAPSEGRSLRWFGQTQFLDQRLSRG